MPPASSPHVDIFEKNRILTLVMNRPERKNALTLDMYTTLADSIEKAGEKGDIRVILICGAGGCFTSGNDLEDFMEHPPTEDGSSPVERFMKALYYCPKPVIAAVEGIAVGIGTTMLLHCDLVYAGKSATFQMPFANLGLCPEFASSLFLPQIMGHAKASELLLLGEPFGPHEAASCGIVNRVLPDKDLRQWARDKAEHLALQPPAAIRHTKKLLRAGVMALGEEAMRREMELFMPALRSAEFSEAVTAFFEKRKPDFSNFE